MPKRARKEGTAEVGGKSPRVLNRRTHDCSTAVYIGRPSVWGNPFRIGKDGSREEVVRRYEEYLLGRPVLLARLSELRGRDLACWCSPLPCHGDVLLRLANVSECSVPEGPPS